MSQFSVFRNRNPRTRTAFPLLVDVQNDLLDDLQTRVVIPLTRAPALTRKPMGNLMPVIRFEGAEFLLMTPQLAGIAASELGSAVGSVAHERQAILGAIDFLVVGF